MNTEELIASWKAKATKCRAKAQYSAADAYESCANELALAAPVVTCARETIIVSTVTHRRSHRYMAIVEALRNSPESMRMTDIASAVKMKQIDAYPYIRRMVSDGIAERAGYGRYRLTETKAYA